MATLRSVCSAEAQFQASAKADEDADGTGEFGGLGELSGVVPVRGGAARVPTDLSGAFRIVSADGEVNRSGYYFRLYLPLADGEYTISNWKLYQLVEDIDEEEFVLHIKELK
ncbi:MAG: hypothetical protein GY765_02645 [bacterium]|nr:hypothetical protein [bacterium]